METVHLHFLQQTMSSLWSKYLSLSPRTRILLGSGVMVYALVAQSLTDKAEAPLGLQATEQEKEELWSKLPRVRMVERNPDGTEK